MGMFDKDKEIGRLLDREFELGETFILWGVEVLGEKIDTGKPNMPPATKTVLEVSRIDSAQDRFNVGTLGSAIAAKAENAEPSDFPSVVKYEKVPGQFDSQAAVLSYVEPYNPEHANPDEIPF